MDISRQKELALIAIEASIKAGKEILRIYDGEFEVIQKEDNSPLTIADQNAHNIIASFLDKTNLPVLSEEGKAIPYNERNSWEYYWVVDPLDGTKEFVKRNGNFTVNIALMYKNRPILGVIYIPVSDELYFGGSDIGSYKHKHFSKNLESNLESLILKDYKLPMFDLPNKFTIVASSSHLSKETVDYIDELKATHGEVEIVSKGSSLKICLVAEGSAHEYPRFAPTMEWDIAAGHGIILGVGKDIIDYSTGTTIQYNKENLLNNWFIVR